MNDLEEKYEALVAGLDETRKNYLAVALPFTFGEDSFYVMRIIVDMGVPVTTANFVHTVNAVKTKASADGKYSTNVRFK